METRIKRKIQYNRLTDTIRLYGKRYYSFVSYSFKNGFAPKVKLNHSDIEFPIASVWVDNDDVIKFDMFTFGKQLKEHNINRLSLDSLKVIRKYIISLETE